MSDFEMVSYRPDDPGDPGYMYLKDPTQGRLRRQEVLIGYEVNDRGVPVDKTGAPTKLSSSQRFVAVPAITARQPLRLDPQRGLVVVKADR